MVLVPWLTVAGKFGCAATDISPEPRGGHNVEAAFLLKLHDRIGGLKASQSQELIEVRREIAITQQEMVVLDQIYEQVRAATSATYEVSESDREHHGDHESEDSMETLEGGDEEERRRREWRWARGVIEKDKTLPSFQRLRKASLLPRRRRTSETEEETSDSTHSESDSSSLPVED